jgi:hypothetical protein
MIRCKGETVVYPVRSSPTMTAQSQWPMIRAMLDAMVEARIADLDRHLTSLRALIPAPAASVDIEFDAVDLLRPELESV